MLFVVCLPPLEGKVQEAILNVVVTTVSSGLRTVSGT